MVDKLTTMSNAKPGEHIGEASDTDMLALSRALVVFLRARVRKPIPCGLSA